MNDKPVKPDESECCGSGCKPCIFDVYEEKLKKWELNQQITARSKGLDEVKYLPFVITSIETVNTFVKIFKFHTVVLKDENREGVLIQNAKPGIHFDVLEGFLNIKCGEYLIMKGIYETENEKITISRSYTPILSKELNSGIFTTIVSLVEKGKMSQFFQKLNVNDIVFWRGPYQEFEYSSNSFKHVLLIGGGTGVVPLYNISKTIVENDKDDTWVNVLCSFKTIRSILLRKEFGDLRGYWNFKIEIFITDHDDSDFRMNYNESIIFKRIDEDVLENEMKKYGKDDVFIVICGPYKFNLFIKESLEEMGVKNENIFIFW